MKKLILILIMIILSTTAIQQNFQCATCENKAKTEDAINENYDEIYLHPWETITEVYVKAGNACYVPDGTCYNIVSGGVGFSYVIVERIDDSPNCQGISHLEVCYVMETDPTETFTQTPESTATFTQTPSPTYTNTPQSYTETPTPSNTPDPNDTSTPTSTITPLPTNPPTFTPKPNGQKGSG